MVSIVRFGKIMSLSKEKKVGILAEFNSAPDIYHACEKVRDAGYRKWDACTPFPVHGLEKAMGLKPSYLPWLVLIAGLAGLILGLWFIVWVSAYDYPLNIGGKPTWSIPAFIPVMFEIVVLFSALTAAFSMFAINKLPTLHHWSFNSKRFEKVTDNKFFIMIDGSDGEYEKNRTSKLLSNAGAINLEILEQ